MPLELELPASTLLDEGPKGRGELASGRLGNSAADGDSDAPASGAACAGGSPDRTPLPGDGDELVGIINLNGIGPHLQFLMMIVNAIGFKMTLCALMAIDTALSYVAEKALIKFFEPDVK